MGATPRIFISYSHSHDDETWKNRVVSQLEVLEHEGLLSVCYWRRKGELEDAKAAPGW